MEKNLVVHRTFTVLISLNKNVPVSVYHIILLITVAHANWCN